MTRRIIHTVWAPLVAVSACVCVGCATVGETPISQRLHTPSISAAHESQILAVNDNEAETCERIGTEVIGAAAEVLFAPGSAGLTAEGRDAVAKIAMYMRDAPAETGVRVLAYSDSGSGVRHVRKKDLVRLSQKRADAVRGALIESGVTAGRITAKGRGPDNPKATRAASRRVEIVVLRP